MRNVVVSEFVTLDGVFEHPEWSIPYHTFEHTEQMAFKFAELRNADALLLGRVTNEGFAEAWPQMADQTGEFGAMMNTYPKHVASTTLDTATWNASVIEGDLAEEIRALKRLPGKDILVLGSGTLIQALRQHDLIDTYRLMIFPVVVGQGRRLFAAGHPTTLELVETKGFSSGVVALTYERAAKDERAGQG